MQRHEPEAEAKGLGLEKDLSPEPIPVLADPEAIVQAVDNLLQNAVRYTPEGGSIRVRVRRKAGKAALEVEDTGIGIPRGDVKKVFEEFFRSDNALDQKVKGTGLGLSLVKKIIEAHKGKIWVESDLGKGTKFTFSIPR